MKVITNVYNKCEEHYMRNSIFIYDGDEYINFLFCPLSFPLLLRQLNGPFGFAITSSLHFKYALRKVAIRSVIANSLVTTSTYRVLSRSRSVVLLILLASTFLINLSSALPVCLNHCSRDFNTKKYVKPIISAHFDFIASFEVCISELKFDPCMVRKTCPSYATSLLLLPLVNNQISQVYIITGNYGKLVFLIV